MNEGLLSSRSNGDGAADKLQLQMESQTVGEQLRATSGANSNTTEANSSQLGGDSTADSDLSQQQINSFSQLVGQSAMEDSVMPTTGQPDTKEEREIESRRPLDSTASALINNTSNSMGSDGKLNRDQVLLDAELSSDSAKLTPQQQLNRQQVFSNTPMSGPILNPSSLSMSLDEMIMKSRPRASSNEYAGDTSGIDRRNNQQQSDSNNELSSPESVQTSVSRIGDIAIGGAVNSGAVRQNNGAKASRRVPYSGISFSSPATKGQRTKPMASNQMGVINEDGQLSAPMNPPMFNLQAINEFMTNLQLSQKPPINNNMKNAASSSSTKTSSRVPNMRQQVLESNEMGSPVIQTTSIVPQTAQGFDEVDQQQQAQQQQLQNIQQQQRVDTMDELMKSLMANSQVTPNPEDMVMSVMSSADGKERRLVMVARETLDNLQRFATKQAKPETAKTKTIQSVGDKRPQVGQQQVDSRWMSQQQQNNIWAPGNQQRPQPQPQLMIVTGNPSQRDSSINIRQQLLDQQQEAQLQTTTLSPSSMFTSTVPTTTTQQPLANATIIDRRQQQAPFSQSSSSTPESVGITSQTNDPLAAVANLTATTMKSLTSLSTQSDSFREIPVSTLAANNAGSSGMRDKSLDGSRQQQVVTSGGDVKSGKPATAKSTDVGNQSKSNAANISKRPSANTNNSSKSQKNKTQQSTIGKSGSSNGGKRKNTNSSNGGSSGKQTLSTANDQANGSKKSTKASQKSAQKKSSMASGGSGAGQNQAATGKSRKQQATVITNGQQRPAALINQVFDQQLTKEAPIGMANLTSSKSNGTSISEGGLSWTTTKQPSVQSQAGDNGIDQVVVQSTTEGFNERPIQSLIKDQDLEPAVGSMRDNSRAGSQFLQAMDAASLDKQLDELERGSGAGNLKVGDVEQSLPTTSLDQLDGLRAAIPGEPQVDYPIYSAPPKTSFDCMSQSCPGGYYADLETQCQVFHICQNDGRFDTFLCPNGTIFSQQHFVCVWWWQVDCQQSKNFYKLNDGIYCNSMFPISSSSASSPSRPTTPITTTLPSIGTQNLQADSRSSNLNKTSTTPSNNDNKISFSNAANRPDSINSSNSKETNNQSTSTIDNEKNNNAPPARVSSSSSPTTTSSSIQEDRGQPVDPSNSSATADQRPLEESQTDAELNQQQQLELLIRKA